VATLAKNYHLAVAYFTNRYPRATDTFIQREVAYLRLRGLDVNTYSVRRSGSEHDVSESIREEKRRTRYLLPARPLALIVENLSALLRSPLRYVRVLHLALRTARPGLRGLALQIAYFQEAVLLASRLRSDGIKHLHNHLGDNSGTVALLAGELAQVSYSITFHGPHIFFDPTHWALQEKVRYARFIVCISHYCRSQMMLFSDAADWGKLKIVRCGVDTRRLSPVATRTRAEKLLYTGRLSVEKGLSVLFESLKALSDAGRDFELTLVGDGVDRDRLEVLARELRIDRYLVFAGYRSQEEVGEYLGRSDIFILPSFAEGVPVSLMEAMVAGVPVVATNVGGVAELVESERTGLLVPPADSAALAQAIARYQDDHELRRRVASQGRERVIQQYNIEIEGQKLLDLFSTLGNLPSV
jgi:colanic acid/amylovoran biosynthesis glycosyltransferase